MQRQDTAETVLLRRSCFIAETGFDRSPVTALHDRLYSGKINASHQNFSRMKAAETRSHHFVQTIIKGAGGSQLIPPMGPMFFFRDVSRFVDAVSARHHKYGKPCYNLRR